MKTFAKVILSILFCLFIVAVGLLIYSHFMKFGSTDVIGLMAKNNMTVSETDYRHNVHGEYKSMQERIVMDWYSSSDKFDEFVKSYDNANCQDTFIYDIGLYKHFNTTVNGQYIWAVRKGDYVITCVSSGAIHNISKSIYKDGLYL